MCVCVDVLFFAVSSGNNKKALAGALVKELLLWRVIVCEKIFSVVKKRGSQRQSCEFRVSFLKVFFPFFFVEEEDKQTAKKKKKKKERRRRRNCLLTTTTTTTTLLRSFSSRRTTKRNAQKVLAERERACAFGAKEDAGFFFSFE